MQGVQNELDANKRENRGDAVGEVVQLLDQTAQQEVKLTQPHESEHVGHEHNERAGGDAKDGGNRVEGKNHVGYGERDEHQKHGREHALGYALAALFYGDGGAQLDAVVGLGDADALAQPSNQLVLGFFFLVAASHRLVNGGVNEERAKDVENPGEAGNEGGAQEDKDGAQHERHDHADHEHFLLHLWRHREAGHDDHEHKEVVDAQAVLGEPAGIKLGGELGVADHENEPTKNHGENGVSRNPEGRLTHAGHVRAPHHQQQIGDENHHKNAERDCFKRKGKGAIHTTSISRWLSSPRSAVG